MPCHDPDFDQAMTNVENLQAVFLHHSTCMLKF